MNTYTAKCDICGTENTVASYGDWSCRQCGQGYTYDECHQIRLTDSQCALLRNPPRWIPVSERLPEEFATVLVVISTPSGSHVSFMSRHAQDGFWQHADGDIDEINVTHWMPLPDPPDEAT